MCDLAQMVEPPASTTTSLRDLKKPTQYWFNWHRWTADVKANIWPYPWDLNSITVKPTYDEAILIGDTTYISGFAARSANQAALGC